MTYSTKIKDKIETAALALLAARRSGALLDALPANCIPDDAGEAYAIQDAIAAAMGPIGGWKVGAKGPDAEPTCAPLPASAIHPSPHTVACSTCRLRGVEAEIAVLLGHDLPARIEPYTSAEVVAAVVSVHPVIEIVCSRFANYRKQGSLSLLADALSNGALVYGLGASMPFLIDQSDQRVQLRFDETLVVDTVEGNPGGDLMRLLVWLANHVAERCGGLRAGQIITTGSCTGLLFAEPDTNVTAVFHGLGKVQTAFRGDGSQCLKTELKRS